MKPLDYLNQVQSSLDYVEEHLMEPLTLQELADQIGLSPYHYYRIFGAYVGIPVMEYVRRRRLAYAAAELASHRRILDIALDYGFQTHAGFTKAFVKVYGLPPERYRLYANDHLPERVELRRFLEYQLQGGIIMEPKILERPEFIIAGYALQTTTENGQNLKDIPAFWQEYLSQNKGEHLRAQPNVVSPAEYGVCLNVDMETNSLTYHIGVEVSDLEGVDLQLDTATIPAATYAVFTTPPALRSQLAEHIQNTWSYIYNEWFPSSGYEFAPGCADFELYDQRCLRDTDAVMDIYIPIVKREI